MSTVTETKEVVFTLPKNKAEVEVLVASAIEEAKVEWNKAETEYNRLAAIENAKTSAVVEYTEAQIAVATELGITADLKDIAASAFASALRGKLQSSIDRAIKAKYEADSRGKKAVSEELEKEIQSGIALKRKL